MTKVKSLLNGIGNQSITEKYYDDWALSYDKTLENWNYKTPIKAVDTLAKIKKKIRFNLDLACGTGMYAAELKKKFPNIIVDGCDISFQSLKIAKQKKIYRHLFKKSFEKKINITNKYDCVSMIGSMTYCKKPKFLLNLIKSYLKKNGVFIFSHRIDLWEKKNFDLVLESFQKYFRIIYKTRPLNYLPENSFFSDKIKIRIVILKKI